MIFKYYFELNNYDSQSMGVHESMQLCAYMSLHDVCIVRFCGGPIYM